MEPERIACCGCFWNIFGRLKTDRVRGSHRYRRRARYNERQYSIEFENLIEDDDFNPSKSFAVTEEERDLIARGRYDALIEQQKRNDAAFEEELRKQEEDLKLEEEAYKQAKFEAAKVSTQVTAKKAEKSVTRKQLAFDSKDFTSWLSQESLEVTSPDLDIDDFDTFLEKVKARSLAGQKMNFTDDSSDSGHATWEATMNEGLEATKIAGNALNALTPIHDDGVDDADVGGNESEKERKNTKSNSMTESEDEELLL